MAEHGHQLLAGGYNIIPIAPREKWPGRIDSRGQWTRLAWDRYKAQPATANIVKMWASWPECGIGIVCGQVVAIDIDLDDEALVDLAYGIFNKHLGVTLCVRIGRAPRKLLVYRTEAPFRKVSAGPIEVLADGQQFVGYGIHPAGHEYRWVGERLDEVALEFLPLVDEHMVRLAVQAVLEALPDGVTRGARAPQEARELPPGTGGLATSIHGQRGTPEAVREALAFIPNNDLPWDEWNRVGLAIFGALGPSGYDLFQAWSETSTKCGLTKTETPHARWASYMRSPPREIGAGTLYHLAGESGWVPRAGIELHPSDIPLLDFSALGSKPAAPAVVEDAPEDEPELDDDEDEDDDEPVRMVETGSELPDELTRGEGLLFRIVDWICSTSMTPNRPLALAASLVTIGTIMGRYIVGPTRLSPHLIVLGLAGTGVGKDAPQKAVANALRAIGMQRALGPGDLMSSSAVWSMLETQPLAVCCIDEYGDFLQKIANPRNAAASNTMSIVKQLFSVNMDWTKKVQWSGKVLEPIYMPCVSFFGVSTFEQFFDAVKSKDIKDGLLNRHILISTHKRQRGNPDFDIDPTVPPDDLMSDLMAFRDMSAPPGEMGEDMRYDPRHKVKSMVVPWSADGEGKAAWTQLSDYADKRSEVENGTEYWRRTAENGLKLALIHAASRMPVDLEITAEDVNWGGTIAIWSTEQMIAHASAHMAENDNQREYKKIRNLIERHGGRLARRKLVVALNGAIPPRRIDDAIKNLVEAGQVTVENVRNPRGKPTVYYNLKRQKGWQSGIGS